MRLSYLISNLILPVRKEKWQIKKEATRNA
ncbi:MAG: hypothetical protein C5S49_02225 [Candidatus Methanogaster sp.]|nr:MAG: hypothetical protein C5S49_02225 [ANME-2 cluster archaeon]